DPDILELSKAHSKLEEGSPFIETFLKFVRATDSREDDDPSRTVDMDISKTDIGILITELMHDTKAARTQKARDLIIDPIKRVVAEYLKKGGVGVDEYIAILNESLSPED